LSKLLSNLKLLSTLWWVDTGQLLEFRDLVADARLRGLDSIATFIWIYPSTDLDLPTRPVSSKDISKEGPISHRIVAIDDHASGKMCA